MKKTTIDTNLLPNVWLTWETTKGKFYLNCNTGKKQSDAPDFLADKTKRYDPKNVCINSGSRPRYAYVKYHKDIERLELAEVTIDTTRKEEIKQWRYSGNKYFMGKDKSVVDENGNAVTSGFYLSQYHNANNFAYFLGMLYRIGYYQNVDEFKKFLGSDTYTVGSGRVVEVRCCWHIQEWYKTKQKVRGPGKQQKLTDKLTAMSVSDVTGLSQKYPPTRDTNGRYFTSINGIIYFERLEDGWSVLRVFRRSSGDTSVEEMERMYLHDDGTNRIVAPTKNGWVPSRVCDTWTAYRVVNEEEAMEKCKRLKYILPLLKGVSANKVKIALMNILRFPELEQMISLGYSVAAHGVAKTDTPKAELTHMFGEYYNEKENSLLRKAGMTKHQLDKHMEQYNTYISKSEATLREMRRFFGHNLTYLDNATFDKYYDAFYSMYRGWRGEILPQLNNMDIDRVKFIKNIVRIGEKNDNVYVLVDDTINRYFGLNRGTRPDVNWYFDGYSDIVRIHDAIDELARVQEAERRALYNKQEAERLKKEEEKRKKIDEERKQYEYEDDTYIIRLPKDSNEIIREGARQHICIGGYTTRHAFGQTNLFFLRRKSDPNIPFYAIEMDNSNRIVQIHGHCNSWLGNHPEAIPTVVRWLRKNGIKCDQKILTCKAKGYGMVNDYVPMPVVD